MTEGKIEERKEDRNVVKERWRSVREAHSGA
jgi:hypothetical protein